LGVLFYRFIGENFTKYIDGGDDSNDYANILDKAIPLEIIG
jgi:type I restriction enzyme M protein